MRFLSDRSMRVTAGDVVPFPQQRIKQKQVRDQNRQVQDAVDLGNRVDQVKTTMQDMGDEQNAMDSKMWAVDKRVRTSGIRSLPEALRNEYMAWREEIFDWITEVDLVLRKQQTGTPLSGVETWILEGWNEFVAEHGRPQVAVIHEDE